MSSSVRFLRCFVRSFHPCDRGLICYCTYFVRSFVPRVRLFCPMDPLVLPMISVKRDNIFVCSFHVWFRFFRSMISSVRSFVPQFN